MKISLSFLSLLPSTLAAFISVSIPSSPLLLDPGSLPCSTHATLEALGIRLRAPISRANRFSFANVTDGTYLLNVFARDYIFESVRVDVSSAPAEDVQTVRETVGAWQTFRGNEWSNKGESRLSVTDNSIEVKPTAIKDFYQPRSEFSVLSFLKSPMILMALFSLGMIIGVPYLLDNMDPEARAEFEEYQKSNPVAAATNPANAVQNFDLASWMAGATSGSSTSKSQAAEKGGQGANKRRA